MIFKRSRPVVKELRDLRLSWNALAAMDAFNNYMDSRPSNVRVIGRCSQDAGPDFIYIFETALTEYPESPLTVLDSLFTELRHAREFPLPPSYIRIARENIVKNLESAREMFRNDVVVRCSQLRNKLKNNFLYNDAVFDVTSELELARKWQGSDISCTPFSFLDKCTVSIMTINLYVNKKHVKGALRKAHAKHLKQPKPMPIQKNNTVEFDALVGDLLCDSRDLGKRHEYDTGLVEWRLRNGMKVAYQQSPKSDMCTLFGFGYGGLSQLKEKDYLSCYYATAVVEVLRSSGLHRQFKNSCDVDVVIDIGHYTRSIEMMSFRRCQLDVALQKVCLLFVTNRMPDGREKLAETLKYIQVAINNGKRLGYDDAVQTARGSKPIYKVPGPETDKIDLVKACNYYNECFKDPSQFTIIIVGNVGVDIVESLIKKYLDSMPLIKCSLPFPKNLRELKKVVPVDFPEGKIRFCVQSLTDTKLTDCFISVPLSLDIRHMDRDKMLIQSLQLMMEERLLVRLRCVLGKIYTVTSEIEYDGGPRDCNNEYAIMTFNFKVLDDQSASKLVDESIDALEAFRLEGPDKLELTRIKGTEDVGKKLIRAYKSSNGGTDVVSTLKVQAEQESKILAMQIDSWRKEVKRILRYQLATSHVSVVVLPNEESESEESESP